MVTWVRQGRSDRTILRRESWITGRYSNLTPGDSHEFDASASFEQRAKLTIAYGFPRMTRGTVKLSPLLSVAMTWTILRPRAFRFSL